MECICVPWKARAASQLLLLKSVPKYAVPLSSLTAMGKSNYAIIKK